MRDGSEESSWRGQDVKRRKSKRVEGPDLNGRETCEEGEVKRRRGRTHAGRLRNAAQREGLLVNLCEA